MKNATKMIVTDLDGTLLRTDKTISERTKTALRRCKEAGIKIAYATGRGGSAARLTPSELFDGEITMNGAIGKVENAIVYNRLIPYQVARPVLMSCNERGIKMASEISGMHYTNFITTDIWPTLTNFEIVDFSQHEQDAEKIYSPNPTPEDESFIRQLLTDGLYLVITSDGANGSLLQIMNRDATKSKAVAELARLWNIAPSEIAAFGDELNDIDMLTHAGIGIAMENALDEIKAVSNFICPSNDEDGLAKWIETNILSC